MRIAGMSNPHSINTPAEGGTTLEGIHVSAMAGTIDLVQHCYIGIETRANVLHFNPAMLAQIEREAIVQALQHNDGNRQAAARQLVQAGRSPCAV